MDKNVVKKIQHSKLKSVESFQAHKQAIVEIFKKAKQSEDKDLDQELDLNITKIFTAKKNVESVIPIVQDFVNF